MSRGPTLNPPASIVAAVPTVRLIMTSPVTFKSAQLLVTDVESLESRQMLEGNVLTVFHAQELLDAGTSAVVSRRCGSKGVRN